MREILFRGKRLDNGEWVEGFYCKHDTVKVCFTTDNPETKHLIVMDGFCDWGFEPPLQGVEVDLATVGQFTGLMDKNGKRIFEGDIVRIAHDDWSFDGETIEHRVEEGFIDYDGSMTIGLVVEHYNGIAVRSPFFHLLALTDQIKDWSIEVIGTIHDKEKQNEGK